MTKKAIFLLIPGPKLDNIFRNYNLFKGSAPK